MLSSYPDKFDIICAADVIYEEEQIVPLIETVAALLKGNEKKCSLLINQFKLKCVGYSECVVDNLQGEFILAFARRNVSIDKVFAVAESRGFQWEVLEEEDSKAAVMEPIYSFRLKS